MLVRVGAAGDPAPPAEPLPAACHSCVAWSIAALIT